MNGSIVASSTRSRLAKASSTGRSTRAVNVARHDHLVMRDQRFRRPYGQRPATCCWRLRPATTCWPCSSTTRSCSSCPKRGEMVVSGGAVAGRARLRPARGPHHAIADFAPGAGTRAARLAAGARPADAADLRRRGGRAADALGCWSSSPGTAERARHGAAARRPVRRNSSRVGAACRHRPAAAGRRWCAADLGLGGPGARPGRCSPDWLPGAGWRCDAATATAAGAGAAGRALPRQRRRQGRRRARPWSSF